MDILEVRASLLRNFGNTFTFHPEFFNELKELVENSGSDGKIVQVLMQKLFAILALGNVDYGLPWLERLKHCDGELYSLHLKTKEKNYRALFTKKKDGKIFLTVFHERSGKKKTSYDSYVETAITRKSEYDR